jgi:hypothetical protein
MLNFVSVRTKKDHHHSYCNATWWGGRGEEAQGTNGTENKGPKTGSKKCGHSESSDVGVVYPLPVTLTSDQLLRWEG